MAGKGSGKGGKAAAGKTAMTQERASAIQSRAAKAEGGVSAGSFAARATRAAAVNVNTGIVKAAGLKK
jgi:hypothetical protein